MVAPSSAIPVPASQRQRPALVRVKLAAASAAVAISGPSGLTDAASDSVIGSDNVTKHRIWPARATARASAPSTTNAAALPSRATSMASYGPAPAQRAPASATAAGT